MDACVRWRRSTPRSPLAQSAASLAPGPAPVTEMPWSKPDQRRRLVLQAAFEGPGEHDPVARAADDDHALAAAADGEERVDRAALHHRERLVTAAVEDGAGRADHPHLAAVAPHLEEPGHLAVLRARQGERQLLDLEAPVVVMPEEAIAAPGAADGVEVVTARAPHAVHGLLGQRGGRKPLEVRAVVAEHRAAGASEEDRAVRLRLHPPQVAGGAGGERRPAGTVVMQHQRPLALVGADGVHVAGAARAHGEERRRQLAGQHLPAKGAARLLRRGLRAAPAERARRQHHREHEQPRLHGFTSVGAMFTRAVEVALAPLASVTVTVTSSGLPRNGL